MMQTHQSTPCPTFGTLLIRRKPNECPSELELRLRPISRKIRIVEKLAGAAHVMVPGSPSVAIRIYTLQDMGSFEGDSSWSDDPRGGGLDGLRDFRDSFEHSIVFFVVPVGEKQRDQLGRRDSFVSLAQRSLLFRKQDGREETGIKPRSTRTLIVSDISQVINSIHSVVQSLSPEKRDKKRKYFAQVASQNYLPNRETGADPTNEAVANHVSKTFRSWGDRFEIPEGDSSVLLNIMGSLGTVIAADEKELDDVPIGNATKEIVSLFFGTPKTRDLVDSEENFDTGSISDPFDTIDDEALLRMADPDMTQNVNMRLTNQTDESRINEHACCTFGAGLSQGTHIRMNFPNDPNCFISRRNECSSKFDFTPMQRINRSYSTVSSNDGYNHANSPILPESYTSPSFHPTVMYSRGGYPTSGCHPSSGGGHPTIGGHPLPRRSNENGFECSPNYYSPSGSFRGVIQRFQPGQVNYQRSDRLHNSSDSGSYPQFR